MNNIAFVPARSGSKRLPNKNIRILNGKPLVYWTIIAFLESGCFDKVIFSSDSEYYFEVISKYIDSKDLEFHLRSSKEAGDKVKIFDYVKTHINDFVSEGDSFSLGLPTAPLRNSTHVKESMDMFINCKLSIFSAVEYDFSVQFAFSYSDDPKTYKQWEPLLGNKSPMISGNTRSQDQKSFYHPNGAIYILKPEDIKGKAKTFYENGIPYIMDREYSIDVDTEIDFEIAESIFRRNKKNNHL